MNYEEQASILLKRNTVLKAHYITDYDIMV